MAFGRVLLRDLCGPKNIAWKSDAKFTVFLFGSVSNYRKCKTDWLHGGKFRAHFTTYFRICCRIGMTLWSNYFGPFSSRYKPLNILVGSNKPYLEVLWFVWFSQKDRSRAFLADIVLMHFFVELEFFQERIFHIIRWLKATRFCFKCSFLAFWIVYIPRGGVG